MNWGNNFTSNGLIIVNDQTAKVFSANQKAFGRERVAVDFEHNTVPGTPEYERTKEPRPVAGHSGLVCLAGDGIYAENIVYTPAGEASAANYEDVSLAPVVNKKSNIVVGAHSWALTHAGAVDGMLFRPLSADGGQVLCLAAPIPFAKSGRPFRTMDAKGREVVDMAALFNAENRQSDAAAPKLLCTLSAEQKKRFLRTDGTIDLAALFDAEALMNGLQ